MDNFHEVLDQVENNIEEHRAKALQLVEDQRGYTKGLQTLQKSAEEDETLSEVDKEDIDAVLRRLHQRLASVTITTTTPRTESQKEALDKMESKIEELVEMIQSGSPDEALSTAQSYLNSCSEGTGSSMLDQTFEALLLSCTSEDQKAVKKRILNIIENFKAAM